MKASRTALTPWSGRSGQTGWTGRTGTGTARRGGASGRTGIETGAAADLTGDGLDSGVPAHRRRGDLHTEGAP